MPIYYGDLLAMDVSRPGAFAADIEAMLSAMSSQVPVIEDVDSLSIESRALAWV